MIKRRNTQLQIMLTYLLPKFVSRHNIQQYVIYYITYYSSIVCIVVLSEIKCTVFRQYTECRIRAALSSYLRDSVSDVLVTFFLVRQ